MDHLLADLEPLRRKLARWAGDNKETLREADPQVPAGLHDRARDNWRPLLAIAECAGGLWPTLAREAATALIGSEDDSVKIQLLRDLQAIFDERGKSLSSKEIVEALGKMEDSPWQEWGKAQKPLSQHGLSRLLRPFRIKAEKWRHPVTGKTIRGYHRGQFEDKWKRYIPPIDSPQTPQPTEIMTYRDTESPQDDNLWRLGNAVNDCKQSSVATVATRKGESGDSVCVRSAQDWLPGLSQRLQEIKKKRDAAAPDGRLSS